MMAGPVLFDIDLTVRTNERIAVMGRSGAGKSTLLGLLYAQRPADVALVPQASALVKPLSVFHNVYMGRLDRHSTAYNLRTLVWPAASKVAEVRSVLASVGLDGEIFSAAGALSGGQQQRTSVARALYNGRPILIGDEPVSALDRVQGADVLSLLKSRHQTARARLARRASRARARRPHRRAGARPQDHRRAFEQAHGQRPAAAFRGRAVNRLAFGNTSLLFLVSALLCLVVADIAITAFNPWAEMLRLARGILRPDVLSVDAWSVVWTVAFAVVGVGIGATAGFLLAIVFPRFAAVRASALVLRSIHELFWALLLIQVFGLGPATGVLAIAIPYTGIFAKVFAEMIEEADLAAERVLPNGTSTISAFAFARLARGRRAVQDLHALSAGVRVALDPGARASSACRRSASISRATSSRANTPRRRRCSACSTC